MKNLFLIFILVFLCVTNFIRCSEQNNNGNEISTTTFDSSKNLQYIKGSDSSFDYIYEFMKIVIRDQKLDQSHGLTIENDYSFISNTKHENLLTRTEIQDMKNKSKNLDAFTWNVVRIGFNKLNNKNWYKISVPIFNSSSTKAVIKISNLCDSFMCGNGWTVIFVFQNGKWVSYTGDIWIH